MHTNKHQLKGTLMEDDISLVCGAMEDDSEDILQRYGVKQEELYGRIERELKELKEAICLVCTVPLLLPRHKLWNWGMNRPN
jgi:hypothetical protein